MNTDGIITLTATVSAAVYKSPNGLAMIWAMIGLSAMWALHCLGSLIRHPQIKVTNGSGTVTIGTVRSGRKKGSRRKGK